MPDRFRHGWAAFVNDFTISIENAPAPKIWGSKKATLPHMVGSPTRGRLLARDPVLSLAPSEDGECVRC